MTSPSVTRGVRRSGKTAPPPPVKKPGVLWGFNFRRPFDSLWGLFSSVRLAIILISTLAVLSIIGMLVVQAPAEVISSPQDYAAWVADNAKQQFGDLTGLMDWLQLFTIFHSWYFKTLDVVLVINIFVGGIWNRAPSIWQKFRFMQAKRADGFYVNSPVKVGVTVGEDQPTTTETAAGLQRFFRKRGFRVVVASESTPTTTYLFIHKFTWSTLATFVFHTSLILTMLCAVLTGWSGFGRNSRAQSILPGPVYAYFQDLGGFSYNQPLPNGSQGVVYPMGTPHNIIYRAQNFVATFDPVRQVPTDFYTDLQIFQDGTMVASKRIRVNDPLTYQGVTFHQASFMMYTSMAIRDDKGNVVYNGPVPLLDHLTSTPDPNNGNVFQTNNAENVPIANLGDFMNVAAALSPDGHWLIGIKGFDQQQKPLFQGAALFGEACLSADGTQLVPPQQYGCTLSNGWSMQVTDVRRGTVLLVTKDSGSPLLWPVLALLVLSLWVTFGFPPRRYWVRIDGDQVRMAALKEHFVNMQRDLDGFARALGNRPLRPVAAPDDPTPQKTAKVATPV